VFCRQNPSSRDLSRCSSREGLDSGLRPTGGRSLESPSLLRRVIAGAGGGLTDLDTPPASPTPFSYNSRSVPVLAWAAIQRRGSIWAWTRNFVCLHGADTIAIDLSLSALIS
jgi:hypothetical protein